MLSVFLISNQECFEDQKRNECGKYVKWEFYIKGIPTNKHMIQFFEMLVNIRKADLVVACNLLFYPCIIGDPS